jgi:N-glycosylase/DNA lyase
VAACVALFGLGYFEAFPIDVWIKRAMAELFPNGLPENILPFAGIAQQYIFHYIRTRIS